MTSIAHLPQNLLTITNRFVELCQVGEQITAAFLVGSYVQGTADHHSDLDLIIVTSDVAYEPFLAEKQSFGRLLGESLFLEDFDIPDFLFCIFANGAEVELQFGRESQLAEILKPPYRLLLDKKGLAEGIGFSGDDVVGEESVETLRRQLHWFWHDLSHFITAMARGQSWWAQGQLEALRHYCINLARLKEDFTDSEIGSEPYFKIEKDVPVGQLADLEASFCPMEREAMVRAAWVIVRYYQDAAQPLAEAHGLSYPAELERVMFERLSAL